METIDEQGVGKVKSGSCCCDGILPPRRRFGSEGPQRRSGDEVSLKIELVVDGGMHAQEPLSRDRRFEALHLALAPSHELM